MIYRADTDRQWERFGASDPYYGVLTDDRFRAEHLDADARSQFFASGEAHVARLYHTLEQAGFMQRQPRTVLDFGCGVGRLVIPFAGRAHAVLGLDVSPSMLEEARRNCAEAKLANVELLRASDDLAGLSGQFDLIHSYIVFQHIAARRGERLIDGLVAHLAEDGIAALHVTYAVATPFRYRVGAFIKSRVPFGHQIVNMLVGEKPNRPSLEMNLYDLGRIFSILRNNGMTRFYCEHTDHGGCYGLMIMCRRGAPQARP